MRGRRWDCAGDGCSSLAIAPVLAAVLAERSVTALVVRGHDGLDEITTAAPTDVWAASGDGVRRAAFDDAFAAGLDQARTAVSSGAAARLLDQWIALAVELTI